MGTLSGSEAISQSCAQSIETSLVRRQLSVVSCKSLQFSNNGQLTTDCGPLLELPFLLNLRLQHHRRWAGNTAIFTDSPEVHGHEGCGNQRDGDAVPDIGPQQSIGVYDGSSQQAEADIIVRRHAKLRSERSLMSQEGCGPSHVGANGHGPESQLIIR